MPDLIIKAVFLAAIKCPARGWYLLRQVRGDTSLPEAELFRMQEGQEVHERARSLHPDGMFAGGQTRTDAILQGFSPAGVIFEAAFSVLTFAAHADWVRRSRPGWIVGEIKSSLHEDGAAKEEHLNDLAYTVMVFT